MNKKALLIWTFLLCFVTGIWADKVIVFNEVTGTDDSSAKITTVSEIVKSGSENLKSITDASNVYLARAGRGLKLGTSKKPGTLTLNLAAPCKPTAIKFKARQYGATEKNISVAGTEFAELTGDVAEYSVPFDGNTEVSSIAIKTAVKRAYITEVTIVEGGQQASVATPTIEGATPFFGTTTITIGCATADAKVYYTLDGNDPTSESTEYTAPFTLDKTATVKAIAYKGEDKSSVVTKEFVASPTVATVAELNALEKGTMFIFNGETTVVAAPNAKYLYLKDATGSTLAYDGSGEKFAFEPGQHIAAGWQGKVDVYSGLFEAVPTTALTAVPDVKDQITYDTKTVADVTLENVNTVAYLKGVTYTAPADGKKNFTITEGEATVAGYNQFGITIAEPVEGRTYDILGVISRFNDNVQFQPIAITVVPKTVAADITAETGSDLATLVEAKAAEIAAAGNIMGDIKLTLAAGGAYTVGKAISAKAAVTIEGDATAPATIDATALAEPLVKIEGATAAAKNADGTDNAAYKANAGVTIKNVKINALSKSLVNDAQKSLIDEISIDNANIELVGSATVFDLKGYAAMTSIKNSTLWSKEGHTGQLMKTSGRVKDLDGSQATYKQELTVENSTLHKVAVGKQLNNFQGKGQKSIFLTMKSTIVSESTQEGNEVRGWLGGQNSTNPTVVYDNNSYFYDNDEQDGWTDETKQGADLTKTSKDRDPEFANAAEGDFTVYAGSLQAKYKIGDPRWLVEFDATKVRPMDIGLELGEGCDLAEKLNEEIADVEKDAKVGDVTIYLAGNAAYTVKTPITVPGRLSIIGEKDKPATIDASENTGAFIQLNATPDESLKGTGDYYIISGATGIDLRNLNINGVKGQLIYDNNAKYCVENVTVDSCTVNLTSDEATNVKGNAVIYFKAGFANTLSVTNSTFWNSGASDAKYFVQYNNNGRSKRAGFENNFVIFQNNTFYNVAKAGQWANYPSFIGQRSSGFIVTDNIFVNCGNKQVARRILGSRGASSYPEGMVTFNNNTYMTTETVDGVETTTFESTDGDVDPYDVSGTAIEMSPMFADAANGNFTIDAGTEQAMLKTGAPRWLVEFVAPDITDAKALLALEIEKATAMLSGYDPETNEAAKALKMAIDDAQGVYDTAMFEYEITAAIEKLKAAEAAFQTTGISNVNVEGAENGVWYTLQGVRVDKPQKGVFIHNGKKVVLK